MSNIGTVFRLSLGWTHHHLWDPKPILHISILILPFQVLVRMLKCQIKIVVGQIHEVVFSICFPMPFKYFWLSCCDSRGSEGVCKC